MIKNISWEEILNIWTNNLWPNRISAIEPTSAMVYLSEYDINNMLSVPTFFGYVINETIVGVNSGHRCNDGSYRSRGLWVDPMYRKQGIGIKLLQATIDQGFKENTKFIWSYPRKTSWNTYAQAGFQLTSNWMASETSDSNAYCIKKFY